MMVVEGCIYGRRERKKREAEDDEEKGTRTSRSGKGLESFKRILASLLHLVTRRPRKLILPWSSKHLRGNMRTATP